MLRPDWACRPGPEWGYRLYASLLEQVSADFGQEAHDGNVTPVSQYLKASPDGSVQWTVNLLGRSAETVLRDSLESLRELPLTKDGVMFRVEERQVSCVPDAETRLALAERHSGVHQLHFVTPTAFKSRGQYQNLPTARLIIQSLLKKWNGCVTECPIEDEDGQGLETLADGLRCQSFSLRNQTYFLKGNPIPGFVGSLTLENCLTGFHRILADALLLFADYSGVGIKTTLGMGGTEETTVPD